MVPKGSAARYMNDGQADLHPTQALFGPALLSA
ncbi:MAG: hypothetical protein JWN21_473 [Sphingomonas bacterium]|nr:hypothetical protein [Sphingomonas bacterium]